MELLHVSDALMPGASVPEAVSPQQAQRFEALMSAHGPEQAGGDPASPTAGVGTLLSDGQPQGPAAQGDGVLNAIGEQVRMQSTQWQSAMDDLRLFSGDVSTMSMQEAMASSMRVTSELAGASFEMNVKMATIESSRSAIETLMKNQ